MNHGKEEKTGVVMNYITSSWGRTSMIFVLLLQWMPTGCSGQANQPEMVSLFSRLKSEDWRERQQAVFRLHQQGKAAIPYLIEQIDDPSLTMLALSSPLNSSIENASLRGCKGLLAAYMIEVILANNSLAPGEFMFGAPGNYPFKRGVIVDPKDGAISCSELTEIASAYRAWWVINRDRTIKELRDAWTRGAAPLSSSKYRWR